MIFSIKKLTYAVLALALHASAQAGVLSDHQGHWMGDLKIPNGPTFKSAVEIFTRADGSAWASFSSPDQGNYDVPVVSVKEAGNTAELQLAFASMTLNWVGDHFSAEFRQGSGVFPLALRSVAQFPRKTHAQTPVAPFPYTEETLAIAGADGVMLGATLSLPKGSNKHKPNLVILVHGSGPATRDEDNEGHATFGVLADQLTRQGIAVLRYDKRGVSRSTGDYEGHTQPQLVNDVSAVIYAMRARKQFNRVGLVGHSEGPMIAAAVAARDPKAVDFMVSMGGVGLPGLDLMMLQDRAAAKDNGADPRAVEALMVYVRNYYQVIMAKADPAERMAAIKSLLQSLSVEDSALVKKYKMNEGTLSLGMVEKPFLRGLLTTNPYNDWRAVRCPVLALNGSVDHQVPVESLAAMVAALREGGNKKVESVIFPSLNHLFQTAKTGSEDEYASIDETIAPLALQKITGFIKKQR